MRSMVRWFGWMIFSVASFACAQSSGGSGGAGGTGTAATGTTGVTATSTQASSSGSTTVSSNTSVTVQVASSSGTSAGACDTGAHGSLLPGSTVAEQTICSLCIQCSQTHQCKPDWMAFAADPNQQLYQSCVAACSPADSACFTACSNLYPTADALFSTALLCSACTECLQNCDAANSCV